MTSFIKDRNYRGIWTMFYFDSEDTLLHSSVISLKCIWESRLQLRTDHVNGQPRSQGLSSYRPLERARRDPGWVWSRATLTIKNIREGSSVISNLSRCIELSRCRIQCIALRLSLPAALRFRIISIPTFTCLFWSVSRQFNVVVIFSVAVLPTGFMESQSYFNRGRRAFSK